MDQHVWVQQMQQHILVLQLQHVLVHQLQHALVHSPKNHGPIATG